MLLGCVHAYADLPLPESALASDRESDTCMKRHHAVPAFHGPSPSPSTSPFQPSAPPSANISPSISGAQLTPKPLKLLGFLQSHFHRPNCLEPIAARPRSWRPSFPGRLKQTTEPLQKIACSLIGSESAWIAAKPFRGLCNFPTSTLLISSTLPTRSLVPRAVRDRRRSSSAQTCWGEVMGAGAVRQPPASIPDHARDGASSWHWLDEIRHVERGRNEHRS